MDKRTKYTLIAVGLSTLFFIIMGTPTALVPNPFIQYVRMIEPTLLDYFFLVTTSIMLAVLISLKLYFKSEKMGVKELVGGGAGFVAFSCPICNVLLVALLGGATIMAFIEPLRPALGVASIAILGYLIYNTLQCRECNTTETKVTK